MKKRNIMMITGALALSMLSGTMSAVTTATAKSTSEANGQWMTGEYHCHTCESKDAEAAKNTVESILNTGLEKNGLSYLFLADHLRADNNNGSGCDADGNPLKSRIAMSNALEQYQIPKIKQLTESGKYNGKIIYTGNEWDMPGHDHVAVGLLTNGKNTYAPTEGVKEFQYLFTNCPDTEFTKAELAKWGSKRYYSNGADALTAIKWVKNNYPNSYMLLNHPSRHNGGSGEVKIEDIRDFNNIAPNIVFGFEGMPGNQMSPEANRCEISDIYGGADVMLAKVGGIWDSLLGEGRHFWNYSNSDFHFKINGPYSSGYWPGEYSKNYTWVKGNDVNAVVAGMRSGKCFSVYGDLINALDFKLGNSSKTAEMGETLNTKKGDKMAITIRFKSPDYNNNGDTVKVDHVDLISGEVHGKIAPSSPMYKDDTNKTTKVIARFSSKDWKTDADGYNVINYTINSADKNRYFRLRGTNLAVNVPGKIKDGEPLMDTAINDKTNPDNQDRFDKINERNYSGLWFYSNPIFMNVHS